MFLKFEKWHGCKNDFIVTWVAKNDEDLVVPSLKRQAEKLCSRDGGGIGADGILICHIERHDELHPHRVTIINSDGSVAKHCGNGMRCVALSTLRRHRSKTDDELEGVEFSVEGRIVNCRFMIASDQKQYPFVAVDMGEYRIGADVAWYDAAHSLLKDIARESQLKVLTADFECVDLGNPHVVICLDEFPKGILYQVGPAMQKTSGDLDGINVHLTREKEITQTDKRTVGNQIGFQIAELHEALVWERGVGPTQACGSGACAIAAKIFAAGFVEKEAWIGIDMPGGRLFVSQDSESSSLILAGPGLLSFEGTVEI